MYGRPDHFFLHFNTSQISRISENIITVRYSNSSECGRIPIHPQIKLLDQTGRCTKRHVHTYIYIYI